MELIQLVVLLIVIGVLLYLVNRLRADGREDHTDTERGRRDRGRALVAGRLRTLAALAHADTSNVVTQPAPTTPRRGDGSGERDGGPPTSGWVT